MYFAVGLERAGDTVRCELRRRAAVEPVICHVKAEHRMRRNYLVGRAGDAANAIPAVCRIQLPPPARVARGFLCLVRLAILRAELLTNPSNSSAMSLPAA